MTEALTIRPPHQQFVALTPGDLPQAQTGIADWCQAKIRELGSELREQRENFRYAKTHKWKVTGWQAQIGRTKRRMVYYAKIKAAVQAGYLIVPNFNVQVMAVRTDRLEPRGLYADGRPYSNRDLDDQAERVPALPAGRGRYVGFSLDVKDRSYDEADPNNPGKRRIVKNFVPTGYRVPDFPALAVKPIVLQAAEHAMSLRLFDRIGVVTGRKKDPVVIGEITMREGYSTRSVQFFIAWWLDTRSL